MAILTGGYARHLFIWGICAALIGLNPPAEAKYSQQKLYSLIGNTDSLLVTDSSGNTLFSKNADKKLVPASTLKIITALVAVEYLGETYRFPTEFYVDSANNLKIKGYGDPLLISEAVSEISSLITLKQNAFKDLIADTSYFENPIIPPGVESSFEPYDAANGALCVNFNTINFIRNKDKTFSSAEPQTPMIPFAAEKIAASNPPQGRITFSQINNENALYAGHLFRYFLEKSGATVSGKVRIGKVDPSDRLLYRHESSYAMKDIIAKLLEYSNNFIANQLLVASGAKQYGAPGNLSKGIQAAMRFITTKLDIQEIEIAEGSGISRKNKLPCKSMEKALQAFEPFRMLMRFDGRHWFKTGTLTGVSTRAGYIEGRDGKLYRFVVMMNTPGKSAETIVSAIVSILHD